MQTMLEMKNINKSFGVVHALKDVNLEVKKGETMALVGENGAGKSTLMKILTGAYQKDTGTIMVDGAELSKNTTKLAKQHGIAQVYQQAELAEELSVAENICLGERGHVRGGIVSWKKMNQMVEELLVHYGMPIHATTQVKKLSSAMKQFVAIAKVLFRNPKIVIFDEPTAVLSDKEVTLLFHIIESLKKEGITIIYISHRLEEVFQLSDRVSVMRDGNLVAVLENKNLTKQDLIAHMLGKNLGAMYCEQRGKPLSDKKVLELQKVSTDKIHEVSFSLKEGEILGIAGLVGSGRTETAMAIFGADRIKSGKILVNGKEMKFRVPADAAKAGIFLAPEDRKAQAMVLCRPIRENISLSRLSSMAKHGVCNERKEISNIQKLCTDLKVKMASIESPVQDLSGGNQQKVVIAKAFTADPDILIFDEPTQGIDVGAKAEIYTLLERLRSQGKSIIVISSEIEEIQGVCDRAIVMRSGYVVGEIESEELNQTELILQYMYKEKQV